MSIFANKKDLDLAQEKITSLEGEVETLQSDLTNAQATVSDQSQTIASLQESVTNLTAERDTAQADLTAAQTQITELQSQVATATESANARAIEIAAQAGLAPVAASVDEEDSSKSITRKEFNALSHADRNEFVRKGGKIK
jgi:peptidoglycan hydrolase CwlO-like protein